MGNYIPLKINLNHNDTCGLSCDFGQNEMDALGIFFFSDWQIQEVFSDIMQQNEAQIMHIMCVTGGWSVYFIDVVLKQRIMGNFVHHCILHQRDTKSILNILYCWNCSILASRSMSFQ